MRDLDARRALRSHLAAEPLDASSTRIIEELGVLQGTIRADLVVVNGCLHAFEIKSDQDTLKRLPTQATAYNQIFDKVTIVCGTKHLAGILGTVPSWWGVIEARAKGSEIELANLRPAGANPRIDAMSLAQLLWRDEVLEMLQALGVSRVSSRSRRVELWSQLVDAVPLIDLRRLVRDRLCAREEWRSDEQQN
jgi:hypothetical protein